MVKPSHWGKIKATAQFVAIGFAFVRFSEPLGSLFFDQWLMLIAVFLTIVSAWQYLSGFWETVRAARSKAAV
jgi:phosphatidylglycerophosphate synthase